MNYTKVGIVDYGMGNHASVYHSLHSLGFRVRISKEFDELDAADVLVLPGVGSFPAAMHDLHERGLVDYLKVQVSKNRPVIGICLGMQLFATVSHEHNQNTAGLDVVSGEIVPFADHGFHVGWNTLECVQHDQTLKPSDGQFFYFNHSYTYQGPNEYKVCLARHRDTSRDPIVAVIRRGNVVGLQFHPEKSQLAGRVLLQNIITGFHHA